MINTNNMRNLLKVPIFISVPLPYQTKFLKLAAILTSPDVPA
jgi:hypothetical protein